MAKQKNKVAVPEAQVTDTPAETVTAETAAPVEPVQLTIADLQLLARVVDLASRRGAFQAGEMAQIGEVFNKLTGFLTYVESTQKKDDATDATAPAASTEEVTA